MRTEGKLLNKSATKKLNSLIRPKLEHQADKAEDYSRLTRQD